MVFRLLRRVSMCEAELFAFCEHRPSMQTAALVIEIIRLLLMVGVETSALRNFLLFY
jgi:hypothetical protein